MRMRHFFHALHLHSNSIPMLRWMAMKMQTSGLRKQSFSEAEQNLLFVRRTSIVELSIRALQEDLTS